MFQLVRTFRPVIFVVLLLAGLFGGAVVAQTIRYVKAGGMATPAQATSWTNATSNLQGAINYLASTGGGQVWVAQGTYKPSTTDRAASFSLVNGVAVYGGFLGQTSETTLGSRPAVNPITGQPSSSTLSGDINNDLLLDGNSYNVVYSGSAVTGGTVLDGFIITGGNGKPSANYPDPQNMGAGMYSEAGSPTVSNCVFTSNSAGYGGGLCNNGSSPTVTNCVFSSNSATDSGGGVYSFGGGFPTFGQCQLINNTCGNEMAGLGSGGGMSVNRSHPVLTSCTAVNNTAGYGGGGIDIYGNSFRMENCLVTGNVAMDGAGINLANNIGQTVTIPPMMNSCTVVGNSGTRRGGGVFLGLGVSTTLTSCVIASNTVASPIGQYLTGGGLSAFQSNPVLVNCVVSNNLASVLGMGRAVGGGMFCETVLHGQFINTVFDGNTATHEGGGLKLYQTAPNLTNCTLTNNSSGDRGGGLYSERSLDGILTNCLFRGNTAVTYGGGLNLDGSTGNPATITLTKCTLMNNRADRGGAVSSLTLTTNFSNCKIHTNQATDSGGGIYTELATVGAVNTSFQSNSALYGGGVMASLSATIQLTNVSFQGNGVGLYGGAVRKATVDDSIEMTNCVVFGNSGNNLLPMLNIVANYCLFETGTPASGYAGSNNLTTSSSPFASPTDTPLAAGSPAIDTGFDGATGLVGITTDLAGNPRFVGRYCRVDRGAYEFQQPNSFSDPVILAGNGTLSCSSPTVSLTAVGGTQFTFSGPGVLSQFDGTERVIVGAYLIRRTSLPSVGTALVNKPGTYTVVSSDGKGCTVQTTVTVPGTACP